MMTLKRKIPKTKMKIEINYNGAFAECFIEDTFGKDPFKMLPFKKADEMSQIFALGAFSCIKECWQREHGKVNRETPVYKDSGTL